MVHSSKPGESVSFPPGVDVAVYLTKTIPNYLLTRLSGLPYPVRLGNPKENSENAEGGNVVVIDLERRNRRIFMRPNFISKGQRGYYGVQLDIWVESWDGSEKMDVEKNGLGSLIETPESLEGRLRSIAKSGYEGINQRLRVMGFRRLESVYRDGVITLRGEFSKPFQRPPTNRKAIYDSLVMLALDSALQR